jgi:hypothetical protein
MSKRIAIINPVGFDGLGSETLCIQYAKLGLDVWFYSETNIENEYVHIYSSSDELLELSNNYDRLLFINLWFGVEVPDNVLDNLILLRKERPSLELCYIYCARSNSLMNKLLPKCDKYGFMFDCVFTLSGDLQNFNRCPVIQMRLNAITLDKYSAMPIESRKPIIFTSGRVASFKGTLKYFKAINQEFLSSTGEFSYIHEGANFTFHKNDNGVSGSVVLMPLFDTTKHPKEVRSEYIFKRYGEVPQRGKLNIYGEYNRDEAPQRWQNYFAGVCCILGTVSDYVDDNSLFDNELVIRDPKERLYVEKASLLWNGDLEYADIEKLVAGVPLFFSRCYAQLLGFTDERLIYNCFSEISDKVNALVNYYDDARECQWKWFVDSISRLNTEIIDTFTKDFKIER